MKKIFVSGCYDILHAGHIQFFSEARALGDHLTVCFASDQVLLHHKQRRSSIPQAHKVELLRSLRMVDEVVVGEDEELGLDFKTHLLRIKPDILAVTEDDQYAEAKMALCSVIGTEYIRLPKTPPKFPPVSTSSIIKYIRAPEMAPLRVDFAGGWLDVPKFAQPGAFVVNCAISPGVTLKSWPYERQAGLGGSGAWAVLNGFSGLEEEFKLGVGWQDPAVIREGGLCVWRSGDQPSLEVKTDGAMVAGRMAIRFTGKSHDTPSLVDCPKRDFDGIEKSGALARQAVWANDLSLLAQGIQVYYQSQLAEGMEPLHEIKGSIAKKYCGGGFGGYALYLFFTEEDRSQALIAEPGLIAIEPCGRLG